ncbi:helix-turn-helix domain-containing protein [Sphingomonas sp. ACRSK]|uniref:helix-turn-helix domain-containing protein n=1 Tax=Sphingomonas sp. ACRSK TaxID=2918213 RepID=UPI001EF52957|nr:MerR family transcriptional regulator [Sphingomonas sp. ACRSK]MCG7349920.1 MerR family transcriptional regulator [Sphingomonas sp. ACRSK]
MALPTQQLFTRQQVAKLVGVSDDMLAYWLKQGLLVPTTGGEGRGSHRRFDFVQVNIAAIFAQIRRFGVNIAGLRSLADLLQAAAKLGASYELHLSNYTNAAFLADTLHRFRRGEAIMIDAHSRSEDPPSGMTRREIRDWEDEKRPAVSESEILEHYIAWRIDYDSPESVLAAAEHMGPGRKTEAHVYVDLVSEALSPGYSDTYSWLLALEPGEPCRIEFGSDGAKFFDSINAGSPEDFGSAIFVPVSGIFRKMWGFNSSEYYKRLREGRLREMDAEQIRGLLAAAGIAATVVVHEDEEQGFSIDYPGFERSAVQAALKGSRFELSPEKESRAK